MNMSPSGTNSSGFSLYSVLLSVILLLIAPMYSASQIPGSRTSQLRLLFIGDIMGHDTQIAAALDTETGSYDYSDVFSFIAPTIKEHDVAIANLEVTLAGPPYKGYPQFSSPAALAAAACEAGISVMVTANNHSVDRGLSGINRTIFSLDSLNIAHTGTYLSAEERESLVPHIISKNGINLALLNYTYGTNGIPVPWPAVVDMIDREIIDDDIKRARSADVDGIIVFIHWGNEYDTLPGKAQTELADWLTGRGVDMVIGSHPHVIQPMILETDSKEGPGLVVYSLGNFVSNQRKRRTDGGSMVSVTVSKDEKGLRITDSHYILTWVYTPVIDGLKQFFILPAAEFANSSVVPKDEESRAKLSLFLEDSRRLLNSHNRGVYEYKNNYFEK